MINNPLSTTLVYRGQTNIINRFTDKGNVTFQQLFLQREYINSLPIVGTITTYFSDIQRCLGKYLLCSNRYIKQ